MEPNWQGRDKLKKPGRGRRIRIAVVYPGILAVTAALSLHTIAADPKTSGRNVVTKAEIKLPTVQKPVPKQPTTGLPEDLHLDKKPVRETKGLDLTRMGWSYNCMDCHKLIQAKWHHTQFVEHKNIKLDHGANRFCLNCHHPKERNAFADYDGSIIPEENVVQLCGRCHGPAYRDWKAGVHGRKNGFWLKEKGPQTQLRCIQCHDPHSPKFKPIKPLKAPTYPARAAQSDKKKNAAHGH